MVSDTGTKNQLIKIENKKMFFGDGVVSVLSFDEDYLSLDTVNGRMGIEGKELKILDLSKESGKITVSGDITGVFFETEKKKKGIFG